jgi:hypothetical protein
MASSKKKHSFLKTCNNLDYTLISILKSNQMKSIRIIKKVVKAKIKVKKKQHKK